MLRPTRLLPPLLLAGLLQSCATGDADDSGPAASDLSDPVTAAAARSEIRVEIAPLRAAYLADEPVLVDVKITNAGTRAAKLLGWMLPAADLEEPLFAVTRGGQRVEFLGAHYKRPAAAAGDFVHLAPGASLTRRVDLAKFYDLSQTGDHDLRLVIDEQALRPQDGATSSLVASGTARIWVEAHARPVPEATASSSFVGPLSFSRCTTTQATTVTDAAGVANSMSDGALSYLSGSPSATPRYTTWFGAYSSSGWSTAKSHYTAIADAFDTKPVTVDCGCKKNYYAYVYPTQPYVIYVCNVFWTAPLSGTDSKGGTLIHEMSHFNVTAATDDWAYGQSAAKSLAISNPTRALDNADSHEYFAENTPAQN